MLANVLHFAHYTALATAILNISFLLLFKRNIGAYIAAALARRSPTPQSEIIEMKLARFHYETLPVSPQDFEFVAEPTSALAAMLFEMNVRSFEGSAFEMTSQEILARNGAFIQKHGKVFMIIRNPLRETQEGSNTINDCIGFSCVLPLNPVGADCYLSGLIKDRHIRASMLCNEGETCDTILVFAIALKNEYRKVKGLAAAYYPFLLRCAEHHVKTIAAVHPGPSQVSVWVQAEHPKLKQHLEERGFLYTEGQKSADGFNLYRRSLEIVRPKQTRRKRTKVDISD